MPDSDTDIIAQAAGRAWAKLAADFTPDYTPEQLESLGVYDSLYRGQGPRLASLGEWKPEWISEHDPKGWAQWYKRYSGGRRIPEEDDRQIKRWASFKARHGSSFTKNPTPRRGWALRNWGIDPSKLVAPDQAAMTAEMLDEYKNKAMQKYVQSLGKQAHILVSGHSGAGKSTLAKALAAKLNLPYAQVDRQPAFTEFLANNTPDNHLPVGSPKHDEFRKLLQATALKTINDAKQPSIVEGAQLAYLSPDILAQHRRIHVNPSLRQAYRQRMERTKQRYLKDPEKHWTPEVAQEKKQTADLVYGFHRPTFQAYDKLPGTLKYKPGQDIDRLVAQIQKTADLNEEVQLQDHQQRITDRVTGDEPRMLVYHGLGSGKSLSALAAAEAAKKLHGDDYGIVVPASLKGNFQKEVGKFTNNSSPEIMSYTGLGMGKQFKSPPQTLIMDEAARLRNPNSAMTRAAMQAARNAKRVMLLTGTPITNAPSDLAPLVSMLQGKSIDPDSFTERYVGYEKVKPGWLGWLRGVKPGQRPYIKNEKELRDLLQGHVDYQPSKTPDGVNVNEEIIRTPLSEQQKKIQNAIRTKIPPGFLWKLDQEFPLSRDELARLNGFLTGMRQVGLSTRSFRADNNPLKAFDQSGKLTTAMKNLRQTLDSDPRKKAIIYSNFIDSGIMPYAAALDRDKIPYGVFHGGIPSKQRQQALSDYNAGKLRALLLGPAAAEGISTKGTNLIQLLDPHWNEARLQQAKGRGLRFDSHADLPEELKNVAVQRYLSQSEEPTFFGKHLLGRKRERTADEVLERLTAEKEQFNEKFRNLLKEIGTPKEEPEKTGAYWFGKKEAVEAIKMPNNNTFPKDTTPGNANVYKYPSGSTQLGRIQFNDYTPGLNERSTPAAAPAPPPPSMAVQQSPGVDSGSNTLRVNLHGGNGQLPPFQALPPSSENNTYPQGYGVSNPYGGRVDIAARGEYLNPARPVPKTREAYTAAATYANLQAEPSLPAEATNPSTIVSHACNPDGSGCTPAMYAKWLQSEQGLNAGYGRHLAKDTNILHKLDGTTQYSQINAPKIQPLNLNKVVMTPPGGVATSRTQGIETAKDNPTSFERPYEEDGKTISGPVIDYSVHAPHEYRLTRGGDATNPSHWTDTGLYTDARQESLPFVGALGEAKEFGRHLGLNSQLGGGNAVSYLDKIKAINDNPDATYTQKVRSNFARPVGTAMQFGRELGGLGYDTAQMLGKRTGLIK
jgi:gluconate kinase